MEKTMDKIVALAKSRGFVYPGSEIYGGLANTWDYGNLGVELKNNVKKAWWKKFVQENPYNVGVDCAILMNPQTWVASGHLGGFSDPLMDCKECHERFRADKLIEDYMDVPLLHLAQNVVVGVRWAAPVADLLMGEFLVAAALVLRCLPAAVDVQAAGSDACREARLGDGVAAVVVELHVVAVGDSARLGIGGVHAHARLVDLHLAQQGVLPVVGMYAESAGASRQLQRVLLR